MSSVPDDDILDRTVDDDETVDGAGSGVVIADPVGDASMMEDLANDLANVNVASSNPAMHQMLYRINKHLSSLSLATDSLSVQQRSLLAAERKGKVAEAVRGLTNPMSVRALEHNYKVLHHVEDLLEVFRPKGKSLIITDVAVAADIISAATSVLLEISKLLRKETQSHKVAQTSHLGWKVIQELERKELAAEQVDLSPILPDHEVRAAEKSLMSYTIDMEKALSFSQKKGGGWGTSRGGGRTAGSRRAGSSKKSKSSRVDSGRIAKGGCHRCGDPHFVRACPKPVVKE